MPAGFQGGQTKLFMQISKLRGNTSADAMPIGPFRTYTQPVNLREDRTRGLAIHVGERALTQDLVPAEHLEEVELDVAQVALVVAH